MRISLPPDAGGVYMKPLEIQGTFRSFAGGSRSLRETRANEDAHAVLAQTYLLLTAPGHLSAAGGSQTAAPCFH